jgi:hypothetical protein
VTPARAPAHTPGCRNDAVPVFVLTDAPALDRSRAHSQQVFLHRAIAGDGAAFRYSHGPAGASDLVSVILSAMADFRPGASEEDPVVMRASTVAGQAIFSRP